MALSVVLLSILLLAVSGGLIVMLNVTRSTQGLADVGAERVNARAWLTKDFAALAPSPSGNAGDASTVWINANPSADPPPAMYPGSLPADLNDLRNLLQPAGGGTGIPGTWIPDWSPGLVGCDGGAPEYCRDFVDDPAQTNDFWQSVQFRCDPTLSDPVGVFLIWSETWFGEVTDPTDLTVHRLDRSISTQIIYKLVRRPQVDPSEPFRCDLVRDVRYFPTRDDRDALAAAGVSDAYSEPTLLAVFPRKSFDVAHYVASVDASQAGDPPVWSRLKERRCEPDPDGAGPISENPMTTNCQWRYEITLQLQPDTAIAPQAVRIAVSQRTRTEP
ncbi:MAG: hypothetical protein IT198_04920 [Acidimicrobiia bacterium]|nr:hypothetical protein [Acidimicrobiia bacterium]